MWSIIQSASLYTYIRMYVRMYALCARSMCVRTCICLNIVHHECVRTCVYVILTCMIIYVSLIPIHGSWDIGRSPLCTYVRTYIFATDTTVIIVLFTNYSIFKSFLDLHVLHV